MKKNYLRSILTVSGLIVALLFTAQSFAQYENYTGAIAPYASKQQVEKTVKDYSHKYLPPSGREGGETIGSALPVTSLPFNDTGNTCNNIDDYDEVCPYSGSTSPDVVYSYTAPADGMINIDLCGSSYDTKVYVYVNSYTPGNPYDCNDDYYGFGDPCGDYTSAIFSMPVFNGDIYYIVIDGWSGDCGEYLLNITGDLNYWCDECLNCSSPEGEGDILDDDEDNFNGGCNSDPYAFSPIGLNEVICGRNNTYTNQGSAYRDTDWYEITITESGTLYWSGYASYSLRLFILTGDCNNLITLATDVNTDPCEMVQISANVTPGTYYLFAATDGYSGLPSGANYNVIATFDEPPLDNLCSRNIPLSNWPILLAIGLIAVALVFRFWRMK